MIYYRTCLLNPSAVHPVGCGVILPTYRLMRLLALLAAVLTAALTAAHAGEPDEVMVVVMSTGRGSDRVSISFPKRVPHPRMRDLVRRLEAESGWVAQDLTITDDRMAKGEPASRIMTSAEFSVAGAFVPSTGTFNLEPFLKVFGTYQRIGMVYIVPRWFAFRGPTHYEDENVRVELKGSPGCYTIDAFVKNPNLQRFTLPPRTEPKPAKPKHTGDGLGIKVAFVGVLAIMTGLIVYLAASWILNSGASPRREVPPTDGTA
ncbi:MAG: hypothetical protein ACUVTZ_03665 [Armatimonadota bacterium]